MGVSLRSVLGDELRTRRVRQGRTLRQVSKEARVSLGYLSEVERGQKEASSELLAAICGALHTPLSVVLRSVSEEVSRFEAEGLMGDNTVRQLEQPTVIDVAGTQATAEARASAGARASAAVSAA